MMLMSTVLAQSASGVVQGGWSYVIAAYAATWIFFLGYTASLVVRRRSADRDAAQLSREDS